MLKLMVDSEANEFEALVKRLSAALVCWLRLASAVEIKEADSASLRET